MTDLVYDEMVGWYDPDEEYCVVDECHDRAVGWDIEGTVDISFDEDNMSFMTYAKCEAHYQQGI